MDMNFTKKYRSSEQKPIPRPGKPVPCPEYPYARRLYEDDDAALGISSPFVWGARDQLGRDVVVKLISNASVPSNELKVLQYLNTEPVRSDPRNHTIPVIEYLNISNLIFVVMPRWDGAFCCGFDTVEEIMHCAQSFLEVFEFLHEHRIVHRDCLAQNAGYNVCVEMYQGSDITGTRRPSEARYALYDFGASLLYAKDTPLETTHPGWKDWGWRIRGVHAPSHPYSPFQFDVWCLGLVLQRYVRHIENIVPELGPFFSKITDLHPSQGFTAQQALAEFKRIYSGLTPSQLAEPVTTRRWKNGVAMRT